jgi:hypothetical protein
MRAALGSHVVEGPAPANQYLRPRWLQAGFFGFAYRLAHLRAPRFGVVAALSLCFLLV